MVKLDQLFTYISFHYLVLGEKYYIVWFTWVKSLDHYVHPDHYIILQNKGLFSLLYSSCQNLCVYGNIFFAQICSLQEIFFQFTLLNISIKNEIMKNILDFFTRVRKNAIKLLKKRQYLLLVVFYAAQLYPRLKTLGVLYYIG